MSAAKSINASSSEVFHGTFTYPCPGGHHIPFGHARAGVPCHPADIKEGDAKQAEVSAEAYPGRMRGHELPLLPCHGLPGPVHLHPFGYTGPSAEPPDNLVVSGKRDMQVVRPYPPYPFGHLKAARHDGMNAGLLADIPKASL